MDAEKIRQMVRDMGKGRVGVVREKAVIASLLSVPNINEDMARTLAEKMIKKEPTTVLGYTFKDGRCPNCNKEMVVCKLLHFNADYCPDCKLALPRLKEVQGVL